MKRLLKLGISLLVRLWDIAEAGWMRMAGRQPAPKCVMLYYHAVELCQRSQFARQMDALLRHTRPIDADYSGPLEPGRHYAAVTFDDGFVSVVENALPELESRRIPATFFVPTGCLGEPPAWVKRDSPVARTQRVISRRELANLRSHRWLTIAAHTVTHPRITSLDDRQAREELVGSKSTLEEILGTEITLISFPHGVCDERIIHLSRQAGYRRVFTAAPVCALQAPHEFVTGRVKAEPWDWPLEFRLKLLGAYRWQATATALKACLRSGSSNRWQLAGATLKSCLLRGSPRF